MAPVRTLLLLDLGYAVTATAKALGTYRRETARIGKRYLAGGLEHALGDDPRPKPAPMLDSTQQAAIVAMVCGPPPEGRARWTVRLVAMEAVKRGIAPQLGRETARVALADHGLKPWREKMWCVPEISSEFIDRMEDVLRLYARKLDPDEPVVCLDERPSFSGKTRGAASRWCRASWLTPITSTSGAGPQTSSASSSR